MVRMDLRILVLYLTEMENTENKQLVVIQSVTCFTLLFLQNHQRPDFLGILSLTQASSVACQWHERFLSKNKRKIKTSPQRWKCKESPLANSSEKPAYKGSKVLLGSSYNTWKNKAHLRIELTPHMNSSVYKTHRFAIWTTKFGLSIIAGFSANSL